MSKKYKDVDSMVKDLSSKKFYKKYKAQKIKKPRPLSLVKFWCGPKTLPFKLNKTYLFVGEIPNMPGHCVVTDFTKANIFIKANLATNIYIGYHTDNFRELTEEEV